MKENVQKRVFITTKGIEMNTIIPIRSLIAAVKLGLVSRPWMAEEDSNDDIYTVISTPEHEAGVEKVRRDALYLSTDDAA